MDTTAPAAPAGCRPVRPRLGPSAAILLAVSLGLCAGYLDLVLMVVKKTCWNPEHSFRSARDFPWTVPAGHVVLALIPGSFLAAASWLRPGRVSLRTGTWLMATLAIWAALARAPLHLGASLLLAAGLGLAIGDAVASAGFDPRRGRGRSVLASLVGVLVVLAALSTGREMVREHRTVAALPPPPAGARNVVLIVWDTVRACDLSLYGYPRETTPNLARWARKRGVQYYRPLAAAPWTYPSHASMFTGQWPYRLNSQWKFTLDTPDPTLAEHLASRGYQTAGFAANTNCCTYETGLARGFAHFEDYALTPRSLLSRTVPGKWLLEHALAFVDPYDRKWAGLQSRGARGINDTFLDWVGRRRPDRPFFAFLNYFDAHEPFIAPKGHEGRFGVRPAGPGDYQFLFDYVGTSKGMLGVRELMLAHDSYDDCIAFLDEQLGRLLDELQRGGLLENTEVIITSDHGEGFGDHGYFGHSYTVNPEEIGVPLVILSPEAPAGRVVYSPVSLRDLPATVVDRVGLSAGSPFPGHSLAALWRAPAGGERQEAISPAFSEQLDANALPRDSGDPPGFEMSLVALGCHYIRTGTGNERLYNLAFDPLARFDLVGSPKGEELLGILRKMLLGVLNDNPASAEVERAYLGTYRRQLSDLVRQVPPRVGSPPAVGSTAVPAAPAVRPGRSASGPRPPRGMPAPPGSPARAATIRGRRNLPPPAPLPIGA